MSKERFELSCCLFNESNIDFILDKKTNEEYVVLDELVPILNQQAQRIEELEEELKLCQKLHNELFLSYEKLKDKNEELEEQLANNIRPKFKIGQEVFKVYTPNQKYPFKFKIIGFKITKSKGEDNIFYNVEEDGFDMGWYPDEILFATKEEAEAKLEELQGEIKWK